VDFGQACTEGPAALAALPSLLPRTGDNCAFDDPVFVCERGVVSPIVGQATTSLHPFGARGDPELVEKIAGGYPGPGRREVNALVVLVARELRLERNARTFDRVAVLPTELCRRIAADFERWKQAGLGGGLARSGGSRGVT
jgi:hypothetical protein